MAAEVGAEHVHRVLNAAAQLTITACCIIRYATALNRACLLYRSKSGPAQFCVKLAFSPTRSHDEEDRLTIRDVLRGVYLDERTGKLPLEITLVHCDSLIFGLCATGFASASVDSVTLPKALA